MYQYSIELYMVYGMVWLFFYSLLITSVFYHIYIERNRIDFTYNNLPDTVFCTTTISLLSSCDVLWCVRSGAFAKNAQY